MKTLNWNEEKELMTLIPLEVKQYVLDLIHESLSIGNICHGVNLPTMVVVDIVTKNIEHIGYDTIRKNAL